MRSVRCSQLMPALVALLILAAPGVAAYTPVVIDKTPTAPLANPTPSSVSTRYLSGFGSGNSFTVFFEDRDDSQRIKFVSTTTGPNGLSSTATSTNIQPETHFVVKDWPINVGGTDYDYRAWASVGNNADHKFYVSNDLANWVLVSTFQIANAAGFVGARGTAFYGFHDVILINGTYYAWTESNQGQTMMARSVNGDDVWEAFASVGGTQATDGPLETTVAFTPTGSFYPLPNNQGYGKLQVLGDDSAWYLAINTAAKPNLAPAALETAFINPANWTWHDGTTGVPSTPILQATAEHDLREAWMVGNPDPDDAWTVIYTADYGAGDGGKALGHAILQTPTTQLAFIVQPGDGVVDQLLPGTITIQAQTADGGKASGYNGTVRVALLDNPGGAILSGSTTGTIVDGEVTFTGLSLDKAGAGYTLVALPSDVLWASSAPFTVSNPVPSMAAVTPNLIGAGGESIALEVSGANFNSDSLVLWNGQARPTVLVSSTVLRVILETGDFAGPGTGTVAVFNPAPGGGTTKALTVTISRITASSPPVVNSATAVPNPAAEGQNIVFSADGSDPTGQAITVTWDFGDGTTATGATATHAYASAGTYIVVATLTDTDLESTTSQLMVTVSSALPLNLLKKRIIAKIPSQGTDKLILSGTLTLPEGTTSLAGELNLRAGTFAQDFTLDAKGKGSAGKSRVKVRAKIRKGVLVRREAKFKVKLVGDFLKVMEDAGLAPGESGNVTLSISFTMLNQAYVANAVFAVTSNGKKSKGK